MTSLSDTRSTMTAETINSEECAVLLHCTSDLVEEMARAALAQAQKEQP